MNIEDNTKLIKKNEDAPLDALHQELLDIYSEGFPFLESLFARAILFTIQSGKHTAIDGDEKELEHVYFSMKRIIDSTQELMRRHPDKKDETISIFRKLVSLGIGMHELGLMEVAPKA